MKTVRKHIGGLLGALALMQAAAVDPLVDSWLTTYSGKYARIYTTDANRLAGNSVTTWSKGALTQSLPAYVGVQEIYSSASWVYLRSSGLGNHVMGPWLDGAFPNLPKNQKALYRIPRTPTVPSTKTRTGGGAIGYFVDGVAMFDSRDAFYWNGSTEAMGAGSWNRDAYVNESQTFDPAYAHQPGSGQYHYHANMPALRYLLGDHVNFDPTTKFYSESTNVVTQHSPILGWVRDGFPIYGQYGYSNATNAASGARRMISGYVLRNGSNGTDNLTATVRTAIPAWAQRAGESAMAGPVVSTDYPLGVRTGVIGNKRTGVMGYTSRPYVLEESNTHGRNYSFCDAGAECAFYGERTVRAVRHQPQDRL